MSSLNALLTAIVLALVVLTLFLVGARNAPGTYSPIGFSLSPERHGNTGDADVRINLDFASSDGQPSDTESFEDLTNGFVALGETFLKLSEATDEVCQKRVEEQQDALDKKIAAIKNHIANSDTLSSKLEIESIRWQNVCGSSASDRNRVFIEKYDSIRRILTSELKI